MFYYNGRFYYPKSYAVLKPNVELTGGEEILSNLSVNNTVYKIGESKYGLTGKKINFLGDSITIGQDGSSSSIVSTPYPEYIAKKYGCTSNNYGIGASTISDYQGATGFPTNPMCNRVTNVDSTADMIVVFGGTNDYSYQVPLGDIKSSDKTTYAGAINHIISYVRSNFPKMFLVFVTPIRRLGTQEKSLADYVNTMMRVCNYRGVPVINLYQECPFDLSDENHNTVYGGDGLHPNQLGYTVIGNIIGERLNSYSFSYSGENILSTTHTIATETTQMVTIYSTNTIPDEGELTLDSNWTSYKRIYAGLIGFGIFIPSGCFNTGVGNSTMYLLNQGSYIASLEFKTSSPGKVKLTKNSDWGGGLKIYGEI